MGTVHAVEMAFSSDSETVCESSLALPSFRRQVCRLVLNVFALTYVSRQASLIRRIAKLLDGLSDDRVLEILSLVSRSGKQD